MYLILDMACIGDESWKFSYNSAIIDFIINDGKLRSELDLIYLGFE